MSRTLNVFSFALFSLLLVVSPAGAAVTQGHAPPAPTNTTAADLKAKPKTKLKLAPNDTVIYVGNLHCAHCAKKITGKLYAVKGVVKVRTDLKADVAIVTPQAKKKLDPLALWTAAKTSGFPAVKLVGPTGTYLADPKTKDAKLVPAKPVATKS